LLDLPAQPIGIVSLIGEQDVAWPQSSQQLRGSRTVGRLPRREEQLERQATRIDHGMDLGR